MIILYMLYKVFFGKFNGVKCVEWIDYHKILHNFKFKKRAYANLHLKEEAKKYWRRATETDVKSVYTALPMTGLTKKELNGMLKDLAKVSFAVTS